MIPGGCDHGDSKQDSERWVARTALACPRDPPQGPPHGFGRGEYKYLAYPLPAMIAELRASLYPRLVPIANRWNAAMGVEIDYPEGHAKHDLRATLGPCAGVLLRR